MSIARRIRPWLSGSIQRRYRSYLSPPFLLDEYTPRYMLISSADAAKKRSEAYSHLRNCNLCPRLCGVNRFEKTGLCLIGAETVKVSTIAPHFGEGRSTFCSVRYMLIIFESLAYKATMALDLSSFQVATFAAYFARTMILLIREMAST
jgi:hypothetical protein